MDELHRTLLQFCPSHVVIGSTVVSFAEKDDGEKKETIMTTLDPLTNVPEELNANALVLLFQESVAVSAAQIIPHITNEAAAVDNQDFFRGIDSVLSKSVMQATLLNPLLDTTQGLNMGPYLSPPREWMA